MSGVPVRRVGVVAGVIAGCVLSLTATSAGGAGGAAGVSGVPREVFAADGTITRVEVPDGSQPQSRVAARVTAASATVAAVEVNGPSDNRIDLVFLGDGYTLSELDLYAEQVRAAWLLLAEREPFRRYRKLFNVWAVDVVSPVSGVSGDPTADVRRDTPLAMTYWCGGLQRLLCVDVEQAHRYAAAAPDADQVAVLANSGMYGGAGYTDDEVVTFAGGHSAAGEIVPHELGHSMADLADEYDYYAFPGDGSRYGGPDPQPANITKKDADQMRHPGKKWWYWLGADTPDGGVIGAYEGGLYTQFGVYRPSVNSLMKQLARPFNAVGREEMIRSFYTTVRPIDAVIPKTAAVHRSDTLTVDVIQVPLSIRWYVDGVEVPGWRGRTWVPVADAPRSARSITVEVADHTEWVRHPGYRSTYLTQHHSWQVTDA